MKGISALAVAVLTVTQFTSAASDPAISMVDVAGLPAEQVEIAYRAFDLYAEAGLTLPPVRFDYHGNDTDACSGWLGAHEASSEGSTITICTSRADAGVDVLFLHELAHAWSARSLTDERRTEFQELRNLSTWSGADVPWHERGTEHAAEILMWGLIDRPIQVVTIADHGCDALAAGYSALTGSEPLHGFGDDC